jgi:hypothetical protein
LPRSLHLLCRACRFADVQPRRRAEWLEHHGREEGSCRDPWWGRVFDPAQWSFSKTALPRKNAAKHVTLALVLLLGTLAVPQDQPLPGVAKSVPSGAETSQRSTPSAPEKREKKEGAERIFGIFPAFNVSNQANPEPLTNKQKFMLFARSTNDPVTLITPVLKVPLVQATESAADLGTGFRAFAKRYGILLADGASSRFFRQFFFPTMLNEDPRYFRSA